MEPQPTPAMPQPPQTPKRPQPQMAKNFLRPLLVVMFCLVGVGAYLFSQNPDSGEVTLNADGTARAVIAQAPAHAEFTAQQAFLLQQFGGESGNNAHRALVARIGSAIATKSEAKNSGRTFRFTVLAEPDVINSFALPTGDIYVTTALVNRMKTEGELAAALANSVAHALVNHRMEPMAPTGVTTPQASILRYTPEQESSADARALKIMVDAGYSPEAYLSLFSVLTQAYQAGANTQFFATHPSADWRLSKVAEAIKKMYPEGVPVILSK